MKHLVVLDSHVQTVTVSFTLQTQSEPRKWSEGVTLQNGQPIITNAFFCFSTSQD